MGEISGLGGGYEDCCRRMVKAGCEWFDAHPNADPKFKRFKNVYGICIEDNDDAKSLTEAVIAAANGDATGAMHQATIGHVFAVRRLGWDGYCAEMRKHSDDDRKLA
jgi:hypothetical protein